MLDILAVPFLACLVLAGILCYFGIHVIMREVIFVDLALAQIAAMGAAVGALIGFDLHSGQAYACSLGFTFVGAAIFAFGRFEDFQNWTRTALPLVYTLERLAPALAKDGPNPEYPWPQNAPQYVPATFDFDVWRQLTGTGRGRQLTQVIKAAVDQFPVYG